MERTGELPAGPAAGLQRRRGVEERAEQQAATVKRILAGEFDRANEAERTKAVSEVVRRTSAQAAALTLEPIPLVDTATFTWLQHKMIAAIARLRGYEDAEGEQVVAASGTVRGRLVLLNASLAVTKFFDWIPVLPDVFGGAVAYGMTSALGELADRYFLSGCTLSAAEMRVRFDALFKQAFRDAYVLRRDELRALFRSPDVRAELRELKRANRDGEIGVDEVARRSSEILDGHRGRGATPTDSRGAPPCPGGRGARCTRAPDRTRGASRGARRSRSRARAGDRSPSRSR